MFFSCRCFIPPIKSLSCLFRTFHHRCQRRYMVWLSLFYASLSSIHPLIHRSNFIWFVCFVQFNCPYLLHYHYFPTFCVFADFGAFCLSFSLISFFSLSVCLWCYSVQFMFGRSFIHFLYNICFYYQYVLCPFKGLTLSKSVLCLHYQLAILRHRLAIKLLLDNWIITECTKVSCLRLCFLFEHTSFFSFSRLSMYLLSILGPILNFSSPFSVCF